MPVDDNNLFTTKILKSMIQVNSGTLVQTKHKISNCERESNQNTEEWMR